MAGVHHVLLLRFDIVGLCLPPLLLVSLTTHISTRPKAKTDFTDLIIPSLPHLPTPYNERTNDDSMRYSRMLEESSFANRKADYFWLLFLSSLMLLVRHPHLPLPPPLSSLDHALYIYDISGPIPALQPPLPLLPARLRADLLLVPPAPDDAHIALRPAHHHSAIPPLCPRRVLLGAHRYMARRGERPRRVRGRPRGLVHTRRVDSRDGRWADDI